MAFYSDIVGHEDTIKYLKSTIASDMVGHAYLIEGAPGSGKGMLADAYAAALVCETGGEEACGNCHACHQALQHTHPDIIYVTHEKPATISVDDIRGQLVGDAWVRPYYGGRKVYIVEQAELMNAQAQNALLKTLEEPPAYVVILLLTTNADAFLDTIRSRCQKIKLQPLPDTVVTDYLMQREQLPDYQARLCAAFAQGSIGKALELARSESFNSIMQSALNLVKRAKDMDMTQIQAAVKEAAGYKLQLQDYLDILAVWYRDVLYFKATQKPDRLIFRDELQQIRLHAQKSSYEGLEEIVQALAKAKRRLDAGVNQDLTIELLFLTIKEN